jgi:hypothetical protein
MKRLLAALAALALAATLLASPASAHETPNPDGHIDINTNYGFEVIGRDTLAGVTDGLYTDVWSHEGYAYIGTYQEPACTRAGVFIVDIAAAVDNYGADPEAEDFRGAVVAEIPSAPNTRVNDVKVHTITFQNQERDVLILTEEKCGPLNGNASKQLGQGGISLWDVTDPSQPHALKQHFLSTEVHNTFAWTADDGRSYLIAVDDLNVDDVIIVDITKPQSPRTIGVTGVGDWLAGAYEAIADDGQLFTGVFAAPLLHDVWVEEVKGRFQAVLSYWDAGFVVLDVEDPTNPIVLGDSTYPDPDPVYGTSPAEGNGHAAVIGGDQGQYLWAGDEDFDAFLTTIKDVDGVAHNASQGDDVPQVGPDRDYVGTGRYVGLGCDTLDGLEATAATDIAIIERGACAFTTKAQNAEAAGYQAAVVFNQSDRPDDQACENSVSMIVSAGIPALFVPRSDGFALMGLGDEYDPAQCTDEGPDQGDTLLAGNEGVYESPVDISADFDGWGYFHVLTNLPGGTTTLAPPSVPGESPADREVLDIGYLGELGYFAPVELTSEAFAVGFGDLTMHNVEGDPTTAAELPTFDAGPRSFISWYSAGMRAVEYRPGHWHTGNGDVFSWNVHEVGRFIAEDGSNFWGVHVDELGGEQIILGSDRNTGLWVFTFRCESQVVDDDGRDTGLYCRR